MVADKNTTRNNKSKASDRALYVLWQRVLRQRLYLPTMLEYTTKKGQEIVEKIKYFFELRQVDKEMRQRAKETKVLEEIIAQRKKELPQVWGE